MKAKYKFANYSLQTKLIIVFVSIGVFSVGVVAFFLNSILQQTLLNNANQSLLAAAQQTAANLDTFINVNLDTVRVESQLSPIIKYLDLPSDQRANSALETEVTEILSALSRKDQLFISSYALLDSQGIDIIDTYSPDINQDKSDREYFQTPMQTGLPFVSPVRVSDTLDEVSIYFSSPVRNAEGEISGVLRVRYDAHILQRLVAQSNGLAGPQSHAVLLDEELLRLADGAEPELVSKSVEPLLPEQVKELQAIKRLPQQLGPELSTNLPDFAAGLKNFATQPFFAAQVGTDNDLKSIAVTTLETAPWLVAFTQSQTALLDPIQAQVQTTIAVTVIIAIIVAIIAVVLGRFLAGPIIRLTMVVKQVAAGNLTTQAVVESQDETGQLAEAFNRMTTQLRESFETLEQRVADRTTQLETVAVLSERLTAILNLDQLLDELVNQVKANFDYYHAHVYLVDEGRQNLVVAAGVGEAGQIMKARGHHIRLNSPISLVARAARTKEIVSADNVRETEDWLPNPLLPDTYSEMAVPIILEEQAVGVLDVQENQIAGLDQSDATMLRSLANQVAVAIRNARFFKEVEMALAESRAIQERYIEQSWQKVKGTGQSSQYYYIAPEAEALDEIKQQLFIQAKQEASVHSQPTVVKLKGSSDEPEGQSLVAPINLSNKTIGTLHLHSGNRNWNERDLVIIDAVMNQVAQTAENLRLFEETRERAGREQTIREITDKLRAAPNLDSLLETAARELGSRIGVRHTVLELGLENGPDDPGQQARPRSNADIWERTNGGKV